MQGKGAGAVNRVELECQVLCAALRQSWVRQDKVGAFTSIRELSHLFPDLLPPPEERNGSNKANYYEVLEVRPGAGLNGLIVGYLRSVRKFLKDHNPKDYRQYYNTMLNAGFVLRKPRLRLSHDLVVARRWLYESQMEEAAEETAAAEPVAEVTPSGGAVQLETQPEPVAATIEQAPATPAVNMQPAPVAPNHEQAGNAIAASLQQQPPEPATTDTGIAVPPALSKAADEDDDEDVDPLLLIQKSWEQTRAAGTPPKTSFEMPVQNVHSSPSQAAFPQPGINTAQGLPVPGQILASQQPLQAVAQSSSQVPANAAKSPQSAPADPMAANAATAVPPPPPPPPLPKQESEWTQWSPSDASQQPGPASTNTPPPVAPPTPPVLQAQVPQQAQSAKSAQPSEQEVQAAHFAQETKAAKQAAEFAETHAAEQAAQFAKEAAEQAAKAEQAARAEQTAKAAQQAAQSAKAQAEFEKQLRKPSADADVEVPAVIRLMEAAHLITKVEVQALKAQMALAPNVAVEQLMTNAGYATRNELASLRLAQDLLAAGKINMAQFQVAMYDERMSGLRMAESLQVRGWLEVEVKNPVEEFKKRES